MLSIDKMSGVIASARGYQKNILNPWEQLKVIGLHKHGGGGQFIFLLLSLYDFKTVNSQ